MNGAALLDSHEHQLSARTLPIPGPGHLRTHTVVADSSLT
jgi:hypothetical protein